MWSLTQKDTVNSTPLHWVKIAKEFVMAKQQYARVVLCVWLVCVAGVMLLVAPMEKEDE